MNRVRRGARATIGATSVPAIPRMSTVQPSAPPGSRFGLSRRVWWVVAGGFGIGLILFLLLWLDMRDNGDFYRAEDKADSADDQVFEPLPAPISGGDRSASGLSEAAAEALRNPPPPVAMPRPVEAPVPGPVADATPQYNLPDAALERAVR